MAELTIITTMGDQELKVKSVTMQELMQVCEWSGYKNKKEWLRALQEEEPRALRASYALAIWRDTGEKPADLSGLDFDTDTVDSRFVDATGRTVEIAFKTNRDGSLKLDENKMPQVILDKNGRAQLKYADTGELLPPTDAAPSTT